MTWAIFFSIGTSHDHIMPHTTTICQYENRSFMLYFIIKSTSHTSRTNQTPDNRNLSLSSSDKDRPFFAQIYFCNHLSTHQRVRIINILIKMKPCINNRNYWKIIVQLPHTIQLPNYTKRLMWTKPNHKINRRCIYLPNQIHIKPRLMKLMSHIYISHPSIIRNRTATWHHHSVKIHFCLIAYK